MKGKASRILWWSVVFIGGMSLLFILFNTKHLSFIYNGFGVNIPQTYPVFGIDISHHQGEINYDEAVHMKGDNDSVEFVYIKTTEGLDFSDKKFDDNAEGFAAYGMKYGFYHYYQPDVSATEQALFYCETVKHYNFKLLPVVDVEVIGRRTKTQLVDSIAVYLNMVEEILEARPMVYTYVSFFKDYLDGTKLKDELYWLASYNRSNPYMERDNVLIWQFSEKGNINGIGTNVDLNVAKQSFYKKVVRERYR